MTHFLKHITKISLPVAILLLVGVSLLWLPSFMAQPFMQVLGTLLATYLSAALLQLFFHHSGMTRDTDMLPSLLYVSAISVLPSLHTMWEAQVAVCTVLLVMSILYRGYREQDTTEDAFISSLILLLASLLVPDLIWLFPFIWIAYIILSAFNVRAMLATLIALGAFVLYLGLALYLQWMENPFEHLLERQFIFQTADLEDWIMQTALMFMGGYFFIITVIRIDRDSVRQQAILTLFALFFAVTIAMIIYPMSPARTLPLMLAMLTGVATVFFRQTESVHRGVVFLIYLLLLAANYIIPTLILDI